MKRKIIQGLISFVLTISASDFFFGDFSGELILFYAPFFSPAMSSIKPEMEKSMNTKIVSETAGSQILCRKVSDLGRECDVLILADETLFKSMASSKTSWRIDFAGDEMVIGIGRQAKYTDLAEKNWVQALLKPDTILGRVDESLAPIGFRTILTWNLLEKRGNPGLSGKLLKKEAVKGEKGKEKD